jgi:hypothetical protein
MRTGGLYNGFRRANVCLRSFSLSKDKSNVAAELLRVADSNKDQTKLANNAENMNFKTINWEQNCLNGQVMSPHVKYVINGLDVSNIQGKKFNCNQTITFDLV